jgi:oligoribonuclease NrnB/cAMP/cGMP phosphodiesterase (DHH superfamily)
LKIIHHNDHDGRAAAAIVLHLHLGAVCIEMDYTKVLDIESVEAGEAVVIVDFSLKPEVMFKLLDRTSNVTWIDHHVTAKDYPYQHVAGLRDFTVKGRSGCELTWMYYHPTVDMPWALRLLGDYDAWRMNLAPQCLKFYEGLKLEDTSSESAIWPTILDDSKTAHERVDIIVAQGTTTMKYRDNYCTRSRNLFGYECVLKEFEYLTCYAMNVEGFGSQAYGPLMKVYDVCIAYVSDGNKTTVSLYSEKPHIDVGAIAKAFGGGGHKGAAGFVVDMGSVLPFTRI